MAESIGEKMIEEGKGSIHIRKTEDEDLIGKMIFEGLDLIVMKKFIFN